MDAPLDEFYSGFLGSFLSKSLKTNQLEVNTDERTLRPIARLKEPRDLFALPKDRDHDCPQQAARWPTECQVLDDRVCHIEYNPEQPEMYYQPTGNELRPRPVGEENGVVVFNYNPVSAVNYKNGKHRNSDGSDSESSDNSDGASTPDVSDNNKKSCKRFTEIFRYRSSSNSWDEENDEDYDDDDDYDGPKRIPTLSAVEEFVHLKQVKQIYPQRVCTTIIQKPNAPYILIDGDCILNDTKSISTSPSPSPLSSSVSVEISNNSNNNINNINNNITNNKINTTSLFENLKLTGDQNLQQFSRSSVGGSKFLMNVHTATAEDFQDLEFESRFESGNLAKAVKITSTYYELYLRPDLYTNRHKQWFYFRVSNTKRNIIYRFSIVNLVKSDSLYNEGMRPLMYSTINASSLGEGWRRCGDNISYYRNEDESSSDEDDDNGSYTLTFNIQFPNDSDTVYFAHSYPYTYTDLQDYLMEIQRHPVKSRYCKLRLLCRSLAGNNVYFLTVTAPTMDDDGNKKKKAIILSARVHPGETPSSWMMKGIMDFITGDSYAAKRLRHKFIFKLIPMLNPDGVIVGNTRSSLTGKDLNRQYRTVIRETYPSIWYTKSMIKRLIEDCGVAMYCDMHAHSRKHNVFIYGCENKRSPDKKLLEQVFPLMVHKNVADKFSFESCKFKVQRSKEGTGRVVIWMLGVTNSYTMEASFGGSTLGSRNGTHFSVAERLRNKIIERLAKEGSSAEEPLNIPLSDYSSDEGDTSSSSSDNEGKSAKYSDLEGPCCQPLKVPPCSPVLEVIQPRKDDKKIKKTKPKAKSSNVHKRSKRSQRAVLDLPTTDPGSDIQFSSDDEIYVDTEGYGTIPRTHRTFLHAEYQRKYQSDNQVEQRMPPELIVTPAKHKSSESITFKLEDKDKKVASPTITEFPPIGGSTRRTHSWHNLNNKCIPKIRINNPHDIYNIESTETLQLKLSLKKQIWTGVAPEGSAIDKNRPLSWGIPPIAKKKIQIKDENEALLTACSQKLAAWQERSDLIGGERTKGKVTINLIVPDIPLKTSTERKNSTMKLATKMELTKTSENKIKKKRNPLTKIAETTQILTRIAKSKTKSSFNHRKLSTSVLTTTSTIIPPLIGATTAATNKGHKFKTGGYVATAVQTTNKKKKSRSIISTKGNENTTESDSEKPFLKKVKSKLKKKKLKG